MGHAGVKGSAVAAGAQQHYCRACDTGSTVGRERSIEQLMRSAQSCDFALILGGIASKPGFWFLLLFI